MVAQRIVHVVSGFGFNTRKPFVALTIQGQSETTIQLRPDDARKIAMDLLQCAEAADQDALTVRWAMETLDIPFKKAGMLLLELRRLREEEKDNESFTEA